VPLANLRENVVATQETTGDPSQDLAYFIARGVDPMLIEKKRLLPKRTVDHYSVGALGGVALLGSDGLHQTISTPRICASGLGSNAPEQAGDGLRVRL
jgi:hypothetical protein